MSWQDDPEPVLLEKLRLALESTAEQGTATIAATARSSSVKDSLDCRTAIATVRGELVAVGRPGTHHMGTCLRAVQQRFSDVAPGDIFVNNDPFSGGSHLPCMWLGRPVFFDGELVCWALASAHLVDVGGMVPGSMTASASEIYQEGLRLPPARLYRGDRPDEQLLSVIQANVRGAEVVMGDINAEVVSLHMMEKELLQIAHRLGSAKAFRDSMESLLDTSEARVRALVRTLPDGVAEWSESVDADLDVDVPLVVKVRIEKFGDRLKIDYSGTSRQVPRAINSTWSYTQNISSETLRLVIGADLPQNEGVVRPVELFAPPGTLVNPRPPAAFGARAVVALRVVSALLGAYSILVPDRISACMVGLEAAVTFSGTNAKGEVFANTEQIAGSGGGGPYADGNDGTSGGVAVGLSNQPVEVIENENEALRVHHYQLVPDTGGAGRYRGGLAIERAYQSVIDGVSVNLRSSRESTRPYGLAGGQAGAAAEHYVLRSDGSRVHLRPSEIFHLNAGELFVYRTAGAGGYGDPALREPAATDRDVLDGKLTRPHVEAEYNKSPA